MSALDRTDVPATCPHCTSVTVGPRCSSKSCDLIRCASCKAYGTSDGRRWRTNEGRP